MVVVIDRLVDGVDKFTQSIEPARITKIHLELRMEGFLIAVLPWASGSRTRDLCAHGFERIDEYL